MKQLHRRVVVTGLGILSPIGNTVKEAWSSCTQGISGITNVDIGIDNSPVSIGGQLKKFHPSDYLDPKRLAELILLFNTASLRQINPYQTSGILNPILNKEK